MIFNMLYQWLLTVDLLNALQVVQRQFEVVRVHVLVERSHDGAGIVGVLQTQCMTQLVNGHQEQIVTWREGEREHKWFSLTLVERKEKITDRPKKKLL